MVKMMICCAYDVHMMNNKQRRLSENNPISKKREWKNLQSRSEQGKVRLRFVKGIHNREKAGINEVKEKKTIIS